jgi:DNA-binding NtrC family response regulator
VWLEEDLGRRQARRKEDYSTALSPLWSSASPKTPSFSSPCPEAAVAKDETDVYRRALEKFDRLVISHIMRHTSGQQNRAAEILGLSRVTLRAKLRHMQMSVAKTLTPRESEDQQE